VRRHALAAVLGPALFGIVLPARAQLPTCSVAATGISFGTYNPADTGALTGSGTVTVTCTLIGLSYSWNLYLSTGNSGSFSTRKMTSAGKSLGYNIYTSSGYGTVWGDGTAGTGIQTGGPVLLSVGTLTVPYSMYGQITPLQDLPSGTYTDTITVTLNYN
jgi:spore coat protein U-like protein